MNGLTFDSFVATKMTMKRFLSVALLLLVPSALTFTPQQPRKHGLITNVARSTKSNLGMSSSTPDAERMKKILEEEANNPQNLKATAEAMKNLKPEDIDKMLEEMDNMPAAQKKQLEAMGMNPDIMRQSIEMMKSNPDMAKQMADMMENLTPEEMLEKSRQAQQAFSGVVGTPTSTPAVMDAQIESLAKDDDGSEDEEDTEPIPPPDAEILDTMYRTAELMSSPPIGKVTFAGFSAIPPVAILTGDDTERDLSPKELKECWADGSLGSTRVDRAGFERVWMEVQEFFSLPIMEKARERTLENRKRQDNKSAFIASAPVSSSGLSGGPTVGQSVPPEQLAQQVKNMKNSDMDFMLEQMQEMSPEQEARMKAMGVDPAMMKKTASMMKGNPLMKNAAKMMMKNMSPEQMQTASQQAQAQMKNMSPEDYQKMLDEVEQQAKKQQ